MVMNQFLKCGALALAPMFLAANAAAQVETDSAMVDSSAVSATVALREVAVEAARIVSRPDGLTYFPSREQAAAATNGYSLLSLLQLPDVRVDEVARTVSSASERGGVQIRVNGLKVSAAEMLMLDPTSVTAVEFIQTPGVRYGQELAYVINLRVRRTSSGFSVGCDLNNALTTWQGRDGAFAKWNRGKSEWAVHWETGYRDAQRNRENEDACYALTDGTVRHIERQQTARRTRQFTNSGLLSYSRADSLGNIFQARAALSHENVPNDYTKTLLNDELLAPILPSGNGENFGAEDAKIAHFIGDFYPLTAEKTTAETREKESQISPSLDLYLVRKIGARQTITANAVGTYIRTRQFSSNNEGTDYAYTAKGHSYSGFAEVIYTNRLRPFTINAGAQGNVKFTDNQYTGSVCYAIPLHRGSGYAFVELQGQWRRFAYSAGVGLSYERFRQGNLRDHYWFWRPKASLTYRPTDAWQATYTLELGQHLSQLGMMTATQIRQNSMEWTVGNPSLRPTRRIENTLNVMYLQPKYSIGAVILYRNNPHCDMAQWPRTDDNQFLKTFTRQRGIDLLYASLWGDAQPVPKRLSLSASVTLQRCWNFGNDYTHCLTSLSASLQATAYFGPLTLLAYLSTPHRFMENELRGTNAGTTLLRATYALKNCTFGLSWQNIFQARPELYRSELLNRNLRKTTFLTGRDSGNLLTLTFAWRLTRGRAYQSIRRPATHTDTDPALLK